MSLFKFNVSGQEFKIDRSYTPIKKIGEGAYGIVCAATDDATQEKVAIKRIKPMARDEWEARHTLREITIMRLCDRHPNVISLRGLSVNTADDELYIIMELMFSDLYRIIKHVQKLNSGQVKVILKQILMGLDALHSVGVIHRDLKPGNLLVTKECQVCISDFGLARFYRDTKAPAPSPSESPDSPSGEDWDSGAVTMTQYVVTRWYRCPELLLAPHLPYATAVDVWSVGCIFAEMLMGEPLFPGSSNPDQVRRILRVLGTPSNGDFGFELHPEAQRFMEREPRYPGQPLRHLIPNATHDALDLLHGLLALDPTKRISVREALAHPYLADAPASPGGELQLSDFLARWHEQELNLDFERKDSTLQGLRARIIEEVASYNSGRRSAGKSRRLSGQVGVYASKMAQGTRPSPYGEMRQGSRGSKDLSSEARHGGRGSRDLSAEEEKRTRRLSASRTERKDEEK